MIQNECIILEKGSDHSDRSTFFKTNIAQTLTFWKKEEKLTLDNGIDPASISFLFFSFGETAVVGDAFLDLALPNKRERKAFRCRAATPCAVNFFFAVHIRTTAITDAHKIIPLVAFGHFRDMRTFGNFTGSLSFDKNNWLCPENQCCQIIKN